jgi:hypothetical protein
MGAARRWCVRAAVLGGLMSTLLGLAVPACQFPKYRMTVDGTAGAEAPAGGTSSGLAGAPDEGGDAGNAAGGITDGGEGGSPGGAGGTAEACPPQDCIPGAPRHWRPVAYLQANAGAPLQECPQGFSSPIDRHYGLNAPSTGCACTCGAQGQVCQATLHIYSDMGCKTECATASPLTCDAVSGCTGSQGSGHAETALISGGSCKPTTITPPTEPTWKYDVRLCQLSGSAVCEDATQACAPSPLPPYLSQLCVMTVFSEGDTRPACPAAYPKPKPDLYQSFSNTRGCSECGCSALTGGSCSGKLNMSSDSECGGPVEFSLGASCKVFSLGPGTVYPTHVGGEYTVVPGTCGVASQSHVTGTAEASGDVTAVCCQEQL